MNIHKTNDVIYHISFYFDNRLYTDIITLATIFASLLLYYNFTFVQVLITFFIFNSNKNLVNFY